MNFALPNAWRSAARIISILGITAACAGAASAQPFPNSVFDGLDHGIYWYQNHTTKSKQIGATANSNFTNGQPTAIYIHGWQNGSTAKRQRETYERADAACNCDLTAAWRAAGWNMGIFYWNQFSDEGEVKDAEAKIWSVNGPKKMRWRKSDGSYVDSGISKTAPQLFVEHYKAAMQNYSGNEIRFMGHSLGSQMVIVSAKLISDAIDRGEMSANLLPKRIALLDPAFLQDGRSYLNNRWTGEVARDYVDALKAKGVIFEALRSSGSSSNGFIGDANTGLMNKTAFRELKPWYFGMFDFGAKHGAAVWHYWWEFGQTPASIVGESGYAPSAATSNARTQTLMQSSRKYQHDQGAYSKTPADDTYKYANK
jgi:hypothetical protein